jgi:hypothetical protein
MEKVKQDESCLMTYLAIGNKTVQVDLSHLRSMIEWGGIKEIPKQLREAHHYLATELLKSAANDTADFCDDVFEILFYLKSLAECFDEIDEIEVLQDEKKLTQTA